MTLTEASTHFSISIEKLKNYEKNGLLSCKGFVNGMPDYTEQELKKVGIIHSLYKANVDIETIRRYLQLLNGGTDSKTERIQILRRQRCELLEKIHVTQQSLDELDYMIESIRKEVDE